MKKGDIVRLKWRGCKEPLIIMTDPAEGFFDDGLYVDVKAVRNGHMHDYHALKDLRPLTNREIRLMKTMNAMTQIGIL